MIGFQTIATPVGFVIGAACGLVPLIVAIRMGQLRAGIIGFIACALSGFACGFIGGVPMIVLATAVVISYAYVNRQDPFTSLAALEDVNFEETRGELFMRRMAALG